MLPIWPNQSFSSAVYQRAALALMSSAVQRYQTVKYVRTHEGQHQGPHTEETRSLCSACRGRGVFINSAINAEVSPRPPAVR